MPSLQSAPDVFRHLGLKTEADAVSIQRRKVAALVLAGEPVTVHTVRTLIVARVDMGRWIADCDCGAGVALHREWTAAYCFACGAVHPQASILWPVDQDEIELTLAERPHRRNQFWSPGETVNDLKAENLRFMPGRVQP